MQRLKDPAVVLSLQHELDLLDVIINHDMGLAADRVLRYGSVPVSAHWWTSFFVASRSVELAFKFIAPIDKPRNIGHLVKTKWADVIDKMPDTPEHDMLRSLREGYRHWQALFQSPWPDLDTLLFHYEGCRNAKEYVLIEPEQERAQIDLLLPLALADIATMSWGAVWTMIRPDFNSSKFEVRFVDTTSGKLERTIRRIFVHNCGVNLNTDLLNEKYREYGYLGLWSLIFHAISPYRGAERIERVQKSRDGTPNDITVTEGGARRHSYGAPETKDKLMELFDDDDGLAGAHADVAEVLANTRDWRLRFFIKTSEFCPMKVVDGVLTDTTDGVWHPTVFWNFL